EILFPIYFMVLLIRGFVIKEGGLVIMEQTKDSSAIRVHTGKFDSTWTIARKKFMKRKLAMISLIFLILITVLSFSAPLVTSIDYERINIDRKSTRLNSSHVSISYAVFCLK